MPSFLISGLSSVGFKDWCELCRESGSFFRDYAAREINVLLWISLIAITALLLRKIAALLNLWAKGRKIPGPPCPSFHGHSKLISGARSGENLNEFLFKSHKKYGSIVGLWLGPTQLLVSVKDLTLIKEVLEKAEDKLPLTGRAFRLAFGQSSLFVSSYEKVRHRRESLALQLNGKLLERASAVSLKVVDCVTERMDSIMAKGLLDCRSFSQHMSFSILGATLFGESFLSWSDAITYEELLMMIAKDACFWASYNVPPVWNRGFWRYRHLCTKLKCLTQDIIQHYKQTHNSLDHMNATFKDETAWNACGTVSPDDKMPNDSILEALNNKLDHREELSGNIMGVMLHGCLTTAGLVGSILTRLVMHPEIQDKIYSELVSICNTSKPEASDVQKMTFLLATVYEAARLLPAGPLLQRCSLKHDLTLKNGVTVPAGAIVVVPLQLVQMDDSSWGSDANQFNPYRFLSKSVIDETDQVFTSFTDSRGSFILNDLNEKSAFLSFGSGTRACVGERFVVLAISKMFAHLLQQFEVRLQPGCEDHPKPTVNDCVLELLPSPKIVLVRRNS
ncbi:cytochrome P450 734A1-like [Aristolochia californica]|uniref:cytochrome P450 734A1-like n=1 Tax=Aristolochia californica TaxID=171875 RepID=UPI0035D9A993